MAPRSSKIATLSGHQHSAEGGESREAREAHSRQVSLNNLALQLQADEEEEHRHQAIIDPQQQRLGDPEGADRDCNRKVQQRAVGDRERRLCNN
jgi:hypothetical protein